MIEEEVLVRYGAQRHFYQRGEPVFREGEVARFYYEIDNGEVKLSNTNPDGKEFIQRIFSKGKCFGEPYLFGNFCYPTTAVTICESYIWKLPKQNFLQLIRDRPDIHFKITETLSTRLYYKIVMSPQISYENPRQRILRLLEYLKTEVYGIQEKYAYEVELTRQQIADLTGLRVETAIRAIRQLYKQGTIRIRNRKIFV